MAQPVGSKSISDELDSEGIWRYRMLKNTRTLVLPENIRLDQVNHRYVGDRDGVGVGSVTVDDHPLDPRLDIRNHSPTGLEWGYLGSGPAQLSLAILCNEYGSDFAEVWYQDFKRFAVAGFSRHRFVVDSNRVHELMRMIQATVFKENSAP